MSRSTQESDPVFPVGTAFSVAHSVLVGILQTLNPASHEDCLCIWIYGLFNAAECSTAGSRSYAQHCLQGHAKEAMVRGGPPNTCCFSAGKRIPPMPGRGLSSLTPLCLTHSLPRLRSVPRVGHDPAHKPWHSDAVTMCFENTG